MLINFRFENFRSFASGANISFRKLIAHRQKTSNVEGGISRVLSIYGANASGKSNVARAIGEMRRFVLNCAKSNSTDPIAVDPYKFSEERVAAPSLFEVTFSSGGNTCYRYGYTVTHERIVSEWLMTSEGVAGKERILFARDDDGIEGEIAGVADLALKTRANMLLLVKLDQENFPVARTIFMWFGRLNVFTGLDDERFYAYSHRQFFGGAYRNRMLDLMRKADPTIRDAQEASFQFGEDVLMVREPDLSLHRPNLVAKTAQIAFLRRSLDHNNTMLPLSFADGESAGTQKMFCLAAPLIDILERGHIVFVDEFDSRFHPELVRYLVGLFQSEETNVHHAQLVFVGHNTNTLVSCRLNHEQIYFCEKNLRGESSVYSLAEFKGHSDFNDERLELDYLNGDFGAVPSISDERRDNDLDVRHE